MTRDERQAETMKKFFQCGGRGICLAGVAVGKTRIATNIITKIRSKKPELKVVVLAPTRTLVSQWKDSLKDCSLENVEVRTFKSLNKQLVNTDLLIIDELHAALSKNGIGNLVESKFPLFLGLTATINRLDENEKYILQQFPIFDTITKEEALENGWIAKDKIYKIEIETDLTEYNIINEQYQHHFSFFNYDFHTVNKILKEGFKSFYVRNLSQQYKSSVTDVMLHATNTMRLINERKSWLYNHPAKVAVTDLIIQKRADRKILTFSQSQQIANSLPYGEVIHSGMTSKKQKETLERFLSQDSGVLHSVKSLEAGFNDVRLSVGIATSFNSSKISRIQSAGRVERAFGDKESEFFNLVIKGSIENKWFAKAYSGIDYITINEKELVDVLDYKDVRLRKTKKDDFEYIF